MKDKDRVSTVRVVRHVARGYVGKNHEVLGSDILAVTRILKMPEQVLGADQAQRLLTVDANEWYPIDWLLDLMNRLESSVGHFGLVRMGRTLFDLSHKARVVHSALSAYDIVHGLDGMYHHANRGEWIGGWKVLMFDAGYAELEKNTPHHCVMEQGILSAALAAVNCPSNVTQRQCMREGGDTCIFVVSSALTDERWDHRAMRPGSMPAHLTRGSRQ